MEQKSYRQTSYAALDGDDDNVHNGDDGDGNIDNDDDEK